MQHFFSRLPTIRSDNSNTGSSSRALYRDRLRAFIEKRDSRMLLDATICYDANGVAVRHPRAAFQLTSGRYQRQFVSLWELFDDMEELEHCLQQLQRRALDISKEHHFNTIVTCTHPASELVRHVRPRIEQALGHEIEISEFGHYPISSAAELELHAFRSRNVLIFTDVMASGTLVSDMAARVVRTAGNVVAVLCVVMGDPEFIKRLHASTDYAFQFPLNHGMESGPREVRVYALTDFEIRGLQDGEFDPELVQRIDFVSALPEPIPPIAELGAVGANAGSGHEGTAHYNDPAASAFTREKMLTHFRQAKALVPGFFASEHRHFSLAVRVPRLLADVSIADDIWSKLESKLSHIPLDDILLLCSVKRDDLAFCHFVRHRLGKLHAARGDGEVKPVPYLVLKRLQGDSPQLHYSLYPRIEDLRGKTVIMLRAAATTSEDMRTIAALLAEQQVRAIQVLCLVNRMGKYTGSFVQRIGRLVTGIGSAVGEATFQFTPIYQLTDIRTDDLKRMHQRVEEVLDKYSRVTDVPHFKHHTEVFRRLMAPRSTHTRAFEAGVGEIVDPIGGAFARNGAPISLAEAMAEVVEEVVQHRTDRLIALIKEATHPEVFLLIAGLIISDVDYLRLSKQFRIVMDTMLNRVRALRHRRMEAERSALQRLNLLGKGTHPLEGAGDDGGSLSAEGAARAERDYLQTGALQLDDASMLSRKILESLKQESYLIFALGLLAHFDKGEQAAQDILQQVLFGERDAEEWKRWPLNLRNHFRDVRNYWLAAFMLHAVHPNFYSLPVLAAPRTALADFLRKSIERLLPQKADTADADGDLLPGKILDQANLLLLELGAHRRGLWHQRIRFLQHHLLHRTESHNPLYMALSKALADYQLVAEGYQPPRIRLPRRGQEALSAAITFRDIAEVIEHLAQYPSQFVAKRLRGLFADGNASDSFLQRVVLPLLAVLENAEDTPPLGEDDLENLQDLVWRIKDSLLDSTSGVHQVLLSFCVPLCEIALDCLTEMNARLAAAGFTEVWDETIAEVHRLQRAGNEYYVLCDPNLLREVLRNLFFNVRYSIDAAPGAGEGAHSKRVQLNILEAHLTLPEPESDELECIHIVVDTFGRSYSEVKEGHPKGGATLRDHAARVEEFGGSLGMADNDVRRGSKAVLTLISRARYGPLVGLESGPPANAEGGSM